MTAKQGIATVEEFFAQALAIEEEAAAHYRELAERMRTHHNESCARLFEHLLALEEEHTAGLHKRSIGMEFPHMAPAAYGWTGEDSPESIRLAGAPDLATPHHCLTLALEGEKRAKAFFERAAAESTSENVRALAREFAAEEQRHIEMVGIMLERAADPQAEAGRGTVRPRLEELGLRGKRSKRRGCLAGEERSWS